MKKKMEFESIFTEFEPVTELSAQQEVNGGAKTVAIMKYGIRPTKPPVPTKPPIALKYGVYPSKSPM